MSDAADNKKKYIKYLVAAGAAGLSLLLVKKLLSSLANSSGFEQDSTSASYTAAAAANGAATAKSGPVVYTWPKKPQFVQNKPEPDDGLALPVLVLYGTEYGFSKDCAQRLTVSLRKVPGVSPRCVNMEEHTIADLSKERVVFLCVSTQGDGVPPLSCKPFYDFMHDKATPTDGFWKTLRFSVLALGDSNYPQFCKTGRQFDSKLEELGSHRIFKRSDIDKEDGDAVTAWMDGAVDSVRQIVESNAVAPSVIKDDYIWAKMDTDSVGRGGSAWGKSNPYYAVMTERKNLTTLGGTDDKETIHIEFKLDPSAGITYLPGDSLGILPQNDVDAVNRILKVLKSTGDELIPKPDNAYGVEGETVTLRDALLKFYDIKQIRVEWLRSLRVLVKKPSEREVLLKLFAKGSAITENEDLAKYIYEHEVLDVLEDFSSTMLTVPGFITQLKPLLPRYYSISSTQMTDPSIVSVTIAIVRYETSNKKRIGVCSTFVQDRVQVGSKVAVFVNNNPYFRLPKDTSVPIVMIGPGTGIAPFRAFIRERALTNATGTTRLYFGCRRSDQDYLYKEELESFEKSGSLQVRTAFSRQQTEKVYVQHLIAQDHEQLWQILNNGGHIYVCGDAKYMAVDVHKALIGVVCKYAQVDEKGAAAFLADVEKQGRYEKDVWV